MRLSHRLGPTAPHPFCRGRMWEGEISSSVGWVHRVTLKALFPAKRSSGRDDAWRHLWCHSWRRHRPEQMYLISCGNDDVTHLCLRLTRINTIYPDRNTTAFNGTWGHTKTQSPQSVRTANVKPVNVRRFTKWNAINVGEGQLKTEALRFMWGWWSLFIFFYFTAECTNRTRLTNCA